MHTLKFQKATSEILYEISLLSTQAKSKRVCIIELNDMGDLFDTSQVESIRQEFLKNEVRVHQITNIPSLEKFTENTSFVNKVMSFRYLPKSIFHIRKEILIFDSTVAIYDTREICILENEDFASMQKSLFNTLWEQ